MNLQHNLQHIPQKEAKPLKVELRDFNSCGNRVSIKQKIWSYIRRNRQFSVSDLIILFNSKPSYIKYLIWWLKKEGYIREYSKGKSFKENIYVVIKQLRATAPSLKKGVYYGKSKKSKKELKR